MLLQLTPDQQSFRDTTCKFLSRQVPVAEIRRLRDDADGYSAAYWQRGAELGWTSLLVAERDGGGSIGDSGLLDLAVVAYEFGRTAAPGPLVPTNLVAGALSAAGGHDQVLETLLSGTATAAWCVAERGPGGGFGGGDVQVRPDGEHVVISGTKRPVEAALTADHLLVTGRTDAGLTQVLVPAGTPGVRTSALESIDLTRRFGAVSFDEVRLPRAALVGEPGKAEVEVEVQLRQALVLSNAESVGAMQAAFDMTMAWAADRYSFGRPLNSYQALKHRFADLKTWLEASHAIADDSAAAVAAGSAQGDRLLSAAKAYIGHYGSELLQECVQLHGGIGVTFEHDLHLFLRRHTVNRALYGTPAEHRARLTDLTERQLVERA